MTSVNPIQIMELNKANFSKTDLQVYDTIRSNPNLVIHKSISKLAETAGVSQPAITRFVKTIGYERYREFRSDMAVYLASLQTTVEKDVSTPGYFLTLKALIDSAQNLLTVGYMQRLVEYLQKFDRIYTSGMGKSFQPSELLEKLARKSDWHVHAVRSDFVSAACEQMQKTDLLIIFTVSGTSDIMRYLEKTSGQIMLVTANADCPYKDIIDKSVVLPSVTDDPEASSVSPVLFDIFVELLTQFMIAS